MDGLLTSNLSSDTTKLREQEASMTGMCSVIPLSKLGCGMQNLKLRMGKSGGRDNAMSGPLSNWVRMDKQKSFSLLLLNLRRNSRR